MITMSDEVLVNGVPYLTLEMWSLSSKSLNCMKLVLRVAATSAALQLLGQQVPSLLGTYCGLRMVACEAGLKIF